MRALVALLAAIVVLAGCLGGSAPAGPSDDASNDSETADPDRDADGSTSDGEGDADGNATDGNASTWSEGDEVASGHILLGSPNTYVCSLTSCLGQEGVESFAMPDVPPPGTVIGTNTTDNAGAGFNVDLYFHDADGGYLGGCADRPDPGQAGEQTCEVPEDAAQGTVDAVWGADLDVVVEVVELG